MYIHIIIYNYIYIYHLFTCCTYLLYRYIGNNMVIFGFVWKWGDPKLWPFFKRWQTDAGVTR